jgi:hypothetical protein
MICSLGRNDTDYFSPAKRESAWRLGPAPQLLIDSTVSAKKSTKAPRNGLQTQRLLVDDNRTKLVNEIHAGC